MISNGNNKFAFGDKITAADIFFYPQIYAATKRLGVDLTKYPTCERLFDTLSQVHEFRNA
jgi:glutathione S-transferase